MFNSILTPSVCIRQSGEFDFKVSTFFLGQNWLIETRGGHHSWYVKHSQHGITWFPLRDHKTEAHINGADVEPVEAIKTLKFQLLRRKYKLKTPTFNEQSPSYRELEKLLANQSV